MPSPKKSNAGNQNSTATIPDLSSIPNKLNSIPHLNATVGSSAATEAEKPNAAPSKPFGCFSATILSVPISPIFQAGASAFRNLSKEMSPKKKSFPTFLPLPLKKS